MDYALEFVLDNIPVSFTPGGKINITDAISAVSGTFAETTDPGNVLRDLQQKHPQVNEYIEYVDTKNDTGVPVTDGDGWDQIQSLLFDHILEMSS